MIVVLTVGLSLSARSSSELALSQQEQESTRVFNAAEAGVEQALNTDFASLTSDVVGTTTVAGANSTVNYAINRVRFLETRLNQGMSAKVQLSDQSQPPPSGVRIYWAKENNCGQKPASIIVSIYSQNAGSSVPISVRHLAYAACNNGDDVAVSANSGLPGYMKEQWVPLQPSDYFLRVKAVYNDANIRVTSVSPETLPIQGFAIRSVATSTLGNENRNVEVNRTLPSAPSVMDYALISGTSLAK
jgi:hypothetical protein